MDNLQKENMTGVNREGSQPNVPLKYLAATSIIGDKVHNKEGEQLGKIADIMLDITNATIEYVVIEHGGFLTINEKYFAVPFRLLTVDTGDKAFVLDRPKEMFDKAPGFDMNHWPETNFHAEATYWSFV